ncbi:hypothetical protein LWI29_002525 [Acer saccharum]|uniref:Uncharacterized protein n=1 Tax=Acer saccharum TaxID=4024 RepID=A0AA39W8T3_ACESA|nr:hypothetical protein LWI29_002525 [Acer saccharum]
MKSTATGDNCYGTGQTEATSARLRRHHDPDESAIVKRRQAINMHLLHVTFVVPHVMTIASIITIRKHWLQFMVIPFTPLGLWKSGMFPMMYKVVLFYLQKAANLADVR